VRVRERDLPTRADTCDFWETLNSKVNSTRLRRSPAGGGGAPRTYTMVAPKGRSLGVRGSMTNSRILADPNHVRILGISIDPDPPLPRRSARSPAPWPRGLRRSYGSVADVHGVPGGCPQGSLWRGRGGVRFRSPLLLIQLGMKRKYEIYVDQNL